MLKEKFNSDKYPFRNLLMSTPFPNLEWWDSFFDKGIFDKKNLQQSIENSQYFQDEYTPSWLKLYYFTNLSNLEFQKLLKKVQKEYSKREFTDLTEVILITSLFLYLCHNELLLSKSKQDLLRESKTYIDYLIAIKKIDLTLNLDTYYLIEERRERYQELPIYDEKIESEEFKDFLNYIYEARELAIEESLDLRGKELLDLMKSNVENFCTKVGGNIQKHYEEFEYRNVPILKYIDADIFMKNLLSLDFEKQMGTLRFPKLED